MERDVKFEKGEKKMKKRRKVTTKDMELLPDPVWIVEDSGIKPSRFFLRWWQRVAERRFSDKERWLDAAWELGYIAEIYDAETGKTYIEPVGFDYNPALARASLGIPDNMPLVSQSEAGNFEGYQQLWDRLLSEEKEAKDGE